MLLENTVLGCARAADTPDMAALAGASVEAGLPRRVWTRARLRHAIRHPLTAAVVARQYGRLSGFALMELSEHNAHLTLLAVAPGYRRMGLGSRLLAWLEKSALTAGIGRVFLEMRESNAGAAAFYRRLGYLVFDRAPGYYAGRESALRLCKDIHPMAALCQRPP